MISDHDNIWTSVTITFSFYLNWFSNQIGNRLQLNIFFDWPTYQDFSIIFSKHHMTVTKYASYAYDNAVQN